MRWFARIAAAVALSALAVAALTWADWPRPLFVVPLPELELTTQLLTRRNLEMDRASETKSLPEASRTPWLGFVLHEEIASRQSNFSPTQNRGDLWFVNLQDGRTFGPSDFGEEGRAAAKALALKRLAADPTDRWAHDTLTQPPYKSVVSHYAWDGRGAAVVGGLCRFDPETGRSTPIAADRAADFLVSANGETLLTFTPTQEMPQGGGPLPPPGDADFVCFDLTADPPTRTRLDFTIAGGRGQRTGWSPGRHEDSTVRVGSYALSGDGRTVAVSETWRKGETWRQGERVGPLGVTLYDTRTGRQTGRLTDYGPPLPPPVGRGQFDPAPVPDGSEAGAFGLTFAPDSRSLLLYRLYKSGLEYPPDPTLHYFEAFRSLGESRVIDLATGAYCPPPHPGYRPYRDQQAVNLILRTDDGALRTELEGNPAKPDRFRVVDADGTPRCAWRPLAAGAWGDDRLGLGAQFVPGTTGLAWIRTDRPEHWLVARARKLFKWPPRVPVTDLVWYDWAADDLRVVCRLEAVRPKGERLDLFVQPNRLAVLRQIPYGGTIEVWDAPPPRPPWAWTVPAVVAVGVLLTTAGVRLRRRPVPVV